MDLAATIRRDEERLQARGYDGLFKRLDDMNCGCGVGDLRPCGEVKTGCRPARAGDDGLFYPTLIRRRAQQAASERQER